MGKSLQVLVCEIHLNFHVKKTNYVLISAIYTKIKFLFNKVSQIISN